MYRSRPLTARRARHDPCRAKLLGQARAPGRAVGVTRDAAVEAPPRGPGPTPPQPQPGFPPPRPPAPARGAGEPAPDVAGDPLVTRADHRFEVAPHATAGPTRQQESD